MHFEMEATGANVPCGVYMFLFCLKMRYQIMMRQIKGKQSSMQSL
jgi:hypothetical protein